MPDPTPQQLQAQQAEKLRNDARSADPVTRARARVAIALKGKAPKGKTP